MKRTLCLLSCLVLLIAFGAPAAADSECWYEYQNGTHDFEQVDVRKATCTEDGYYILECRQCGKNVKEITEKAPGHRWQKVDSESYSPTCTQDGLTTYVCGDCSQIRTESVRATGHDMRDEAVVRSPTCEIEGRMAIRCSRCGYSDVRDIPRADLPRAAQVGAFRHGGHDDDFDLREGALDPLRCVQPALAAARDHIHKDQIHWKSQTINVCQRGVVDGQRHLEVLR